MFFSSVYYNTRSSFVGCWGAQWTCKSQVTKNSTSVRSSRTPSDSRNSELFLGECVSKCECGCECGAGGVLEEAACANPCRWGSFGDFILEKNMVN